MPAKGFSPFARARQRLPRSSSLMPRETWPNDFRSPRVWGLGLTGCFLRLPAGVSGSSPGFEGGSVVRRGEDLGFRAAGGRRGAPGEALHQGAVEPDDRFGDSAVGADAKERRDGFEAERVRGGPGLAVVERLELCAESVVECLRLAGSSCVTATIEKGPPSAIRRIRSRNGEVRLAGRTGRLEDGVDGLARALRVGGRAGSSRSGIFGKGAPGSQGSHDQGL